MATFWARRGADGREVLVVWGWCPFHGGGSKGLFSLPNEQEAAELVSLVHQELQAQPMTPLEQERGFL